MAISNDERVRTVLALLKAGLGPFVEREFKRTYPERGAAEACRFLGEDRLNAKRPMTEWDAVALLKVMGNAWNEVFCATLGGDERSLVKLLRSARNRWAHPLQPFSNDEAELALTLALRLLKAVSAPQVDEVRKMKDELRRLIVEEQMRNEKPTGAGGGVSTPRGSPDTPKQEAQLGNAEVNAVSGQGRQTESAPPQTPPRRPEGVPEPKGTWKLPGPQDKYILVESYITQDYKGWTIRPSSKAAGGNRLVTDSTTGKSVSLDVRFSRDKLQKHNEKYKKHLGNKLIAEGWWSFRKQHLQNSRAGFCMFVLPSVSQQKICFVIIPPRELLKRLQPIRGHIEDRIDVYFWPTKDARCWETRTLSREFDEAIDNGTYSDPARDFSTFLNAWHLVAEKLR